MLLPRVPGDLPPCLWAAVVSVAGAIGGSPLATEPSQLLASTFEALLRNQECDRGDGRALDSLELRTRRRWLAEHELPREIRYYSVVALPDREHVSSLLLPSYDQLSQIDPRNDGQLLFYDQVIPGGSLLGYVNADHWAVAVSIARARPIVARLFVDRNPFPREILLEALVRLVEEQYLEASSR